LPSSVWALRVDGGEGFLSYRFLQYPATHGVQILPERHVAICRDDGNPAQN